MPKFDNTIETIKTDTTLEKVWYRLKVPGGWMVTVQDTTFKDMNSVFTPDPIQDWEPTTTDDE